MSAYEQSAAERRILIEKAQKRATLRAEFIKQTTNPFRHGEGGTLFDPAIQRHQAMRINHVEYFRPTGTTLKALMVVVVPMLLYGYLVKSDRDAKEHEYRTGQVAYKDRRFKFI